MGQFTTQRRVTLSPTVYNIIPLLKAHNLWNNLDFDDKFGFIGIATGIFLIQFGAVIVLLSENFEQHFYDQFLSDLHGLENDIAASAVAIKILALTILTVYFFRESIIAYTDLSLCDYIEALSNWQSRRVMKRIVYLQYFLLILSSILSILIITQQDNPWDAIKDCLAVTFLLQVDGWMWDLCILHPCFNSIRMISEINVYNYTL